MSARIPVAPNSSTAREGSVLAQVGPTEDGNARLLVEEHGHEIRYCRERGQWLAWDGTRWLWDAEDRVTEMWRVWARKLTYFSPEERAHRKSSLTQRGVAATVRLARSDARVVVKLDDLDSRAFELNTPGGIVDLRQGGVHASDPAALHTHMTAVTPSVAEPKLWLNFLTQTFAGDEQLTRYVQQLLGVSLIGNQLEQVMPFCYGEGANGKSTLLKTVQRILGTYAQTASDGLLTSSTQHPTEVARLRGARFVVASELEDGQKLAEAKVKRLTGGDVQTARFMGRDFVDFLPTHTLWLQANSQPSVAVGGVAIWRRIRVVPFTHEVPEDDREAGLDLKLFESEGPAILGWMVRGAVDYQAHGLVVPESVQIATAVYEQEQDSVARFVDENCIIVPSGSVTIKFLFGKYRDYCADLGETPASNKAFSQRLYKLPGVTGRKISGVRHYDGITDRPIHSVFQDG